MSDSSPVVAVDPVDPPAQVRKSRKISAKLLPVEESQAGALVGKGAARPKRQAGAKALRNLKLWRDACLKVLGVQRTIRKSSDKYPDVKALYEKLKAE